MSNYNVSDKVEGSQWTAENHNAMKLAINSKLDANVVLIDPEQPGSNSTVYSSGAVEDLLDANNNFKYRGPLAADSDLNTFRDIGFYVLPESVTPTHATYPESTEDFQDGGELVVYRKSNVINQILTLNGNGLSEPPHMYRRGSVDGGFTWGNWFEFASIAWLQENVPGLGPAGTPSVTCGPGIDLTVVADDLKGFVSFVNNTGSPIGVGTNIKIEFQFPRPNLKTIQLTPYISSELIVSPYGPPTSTEVFIRINEGILDGDTGSFFYLLA